MDSIIKFNKIYLPNGIKCILYKRPEIHSVSVSVTVNVGCLDENDKNNGISHLLEHLPFNGTLNLPNWEEVDKFNNNIAGSCNAYTYLSHTKYYGTFPSQYLEQALFYFSELVFNPLLKEGDIQKERGIILDEMQRDEDTVEAKVYENLRLNRFKLNNTPYSYRVIGSEENVSGFTRDDVLEHYHKYYIPENTEIYIVGNFEEEIVKVMLERYFTDNIKDRTFSKKTERKFLKEYPEYSDFKIHALQKGDVDQYYLTATFPTYEQMKRTQKERIAVSFLSKSLASGQFQKSLLWRRLREELNLVYGVEAHQYHVYQRGVFIIETAFKPVHTEVILEELYKAIQQCITKTLSPDVFNERKKRLLDTQLMILDNPENVLSWIEDQEEELELNGKQMFIEEYLETIKNYEFEEVLEAAKNVLDLSKMNIGIVSENDPKEVEDSVTNIWNKITAA
jgi:predicted Zn-dependent peptidase